MSDLASPASDPATAGSTRFLVVGYGHPEHRDDGIGAQVVAHLAAKDYAHVTTVAVPSLRPELSGKLAAASHVIFVDACKTEATTPVKVTPIAPYGVETSGSSTPALGHSCDPASLLALTASVYGRVPQAWWIEVPAVDFGPGQELSSLAQAGVAAALAHIEALIQANR
ncbi:hypothetical protein XM38_016920 [Halomicronema hongdechloris C2206]|uniref:Hydrogenase maturation protease n=1 Tax=Halomicronema hongdechloris C2206 TaxID=1641165 RepID=A0A1Z3HKF8_9CYAN|nr:hydrogenase maturation protease [Halomicronema hongdechloris]ASC70746.1 hypothetical protein XM38_016920 [Halomicronema hongdechloris C2206]